MTTPNRAEQSEPPPCPFCRLSAGLLLIAAIVAPQTASALELETDLVREFNAPQGFQAGESIAEGNGAETLLAANYQPPGENAGPAACYVIIANDDDASGYPIRYQSRETGCAGLTAHPDGGLFLRGVRATEGTTPGGFTMRLDSMGDTQWTADDATVAEAEDFEGSYSQPSPVMSYSAESKYLLTFTLGSIAIGSQTRDVTHGSALRNDSGAFQTKAIRLGNSQGFGLIGGVETLPNSGDFLIFVFDPTTDGAEFFTYDGRQQVDAFEPRGENWSERTVIQMRAGAGGRIFLTWIDATADTPATKMTAVTQSGAEIWSATYSPEVSVGDEQTTLGPPSGMWVGADNAVLFYGSGHLRVIDAGSGDARGVVPLADATGEGFQPLDILKGDGGQLKLLAVATEGEQPTYRELALSFSGSTTTGDAGMTDTSSGGNGGGSQSDSACSTTPGTPDASFLGLLVVVGLVWSGRRSRNQK